MQIVFPSLSQITGRGIFFIKIIEHLLSGKEIFQIENNMYYNQDIIHAISERVPSGGALGFFSYYHFY